MVKAIIYSGKENELNKVISNAYFQKDKMKKDRIKMANFDERARFTEEACMVEGFDRLTLDLTNEDDLSEFRRVKSLFTGTDFVKRVEDIARSEVCLLSKNSFKNFVDAINVCSGLSRLIDNSNKTENRSAAMFLIKE